MLSEGQGGLHRCSCHMVRHPKHCVLHWCHPERVVDNPSAAWLPCSMPIWDACLHVHLQTQWPARLGFRQLQTSNKQMPASGLQYTQPPVSTVALGAGYLKHMIPAGYTEPPTCQRHGLTGRLVTVASQHQPAARSAGGQHCSVNAHSSAIDQEPSLVCSKGCSCQLLGLTNGALRV